MTEIVTRSIPYQCPRRYCALFAQKKGTVLLDGGTDETGAVSFPDKGRISYVGVDPYLFSRQTLSEGNGFDWLKAHLPKIKLSYDSLPVPFAGGVMGYLGYEMGGALEDLPTPHPCAHGVPDMCLGFYDLILAFDHTQEKAWILSTGMPEENDANRLKRAADRADWLEGELADLPPLSPVPLYRGKWQSETSDAAFEKTVARTRDYIIAGDIFQANLARRFSASLPTKPDSFALFRRLMAVNAAPFAAYFNMGEEQALLSASPERFLALDAAGHIITEPIKGTRPRHSDPEKDKAEADALLASAKDKAENLMIVDLMRNDLSRVAELGSVQVLVLFGLESFRGVHHLVSTVTARLMPEKNAVDLLCATYPGGSITGAPKIRAMEIIRELEPVRRGAYCGSFIRLGFDGALDSSILIRTLMLSGSDIWAHAGGGIVFDSDPVLESEETHHKARHLLAVLEPEI